MRTLLHLSDLHFGRVDGALLEPLRSFAHELGPDLVVVSGDLTQRARSTQFRAARDFLDSLPQPRLVVPGNHDVPLTNPVSRFLSPLAKYRRHIAEDLEPSHVDEEIAVLGLNSARSLTIKDGRISVEQIERLQQRLCGLPERLTKIVVSHHPFDLPGAAGRGDVIGRAQPALRMFAECGADLLLAGHVHIGSAGSTEVRRPEGARSVLVVQAGTATSTRGRGQANSFNVIRVEQDAIEVQPVFWDADRKDFQASNAERFVQKPSGWISVSPRSGERAG